MAKGFTVKAKAPTKEAPKWDIPAIKQRMKGKTVVFCLPGRGCSYTFLKNFVQLCFDMVQSGMSIQISQDYSSMVNFARCKCLGANVLRGPKQIPWDGKLEYDWQLWIDNDIVFNAISKSNNQINIVIDKNWREYWEARMENPLKDAETLKIDENSYPLPRATVQLLAPMIPSPSNLLLQPDAHPDPSAVHSTRFRKK